MIEVPTFLPRSEFQGLMDWARTQFVLTEGLPIVICPPPVRAAIIPPQFATALGVVLRNHNSNDNRVAS